MSESETENEYLDIDATPIQICGSAVSRLSDFWDEVTTRTGKGHGEFIEKIFGPIWHEGNTGEAFEAEMKNWHEEPEDIRPLGILQAALTCCAYASQAMKAQLNDDIVSAWKYTARCQYWNGIVIGSWSIRSEQGLSRSGFARLGTDARHTENRAAKADVFRWLDTHGATFKSKDAVAEAIAGKVVPYKFRTVRDWVNDWEKLRSAGKP